MFSSLLALNAKQSDGQDPKYRVDVGKEDSTPHLVWVKSSLVGPKQTCVQKEYFGEHWKACLCCLLPDSPVLSGFSCLEAYT